MEETKSRLIKLFGEENVLDGKETAFCASNKSTAKSIPPRYVAKPCNAEQVEELVKWAGENSTPLIPVSSQAPHYNGGSIPSVPGGVLVDLSGMKKVLSINRTHRIAIVEPGVTYGELLPALKKEGLTISMPLAPRAGKSVMASVLETEPRLNSLHQWCFLDPLRCVEVTWGDGRRMYTGEAAGAVRDLEAQWKEEKWQWEPVGPFMLDFYRLLTGAQGTMGIVTWASIRCEMLEKAKRGFLVPADSLEELTGFAYEVIRRRYSDMFFIMNGAELACLMGGDVAEIEKLETELPAYIAVVGLFGRDFLPEEKVAYQSADVEGIAQNHGLRLLPSIGALRGDAVIERAMTPCGPGAYWKEAKTGAFREIFFETTLDKSGAYIDKVLSFSAAEGYGADRVGVYLQPENMGTSYRLTFTFPYDEGCKREGTVIKALYERASIELSALGAYFLRPYGMWSRLQLNRDAGSYQALLKLRGIFDPKGIMNPGKLINN